MDKINSNASSNHKLPPLQVCTLLYDNLLSTSASLPVEMLRTAEAAARGQQHAARSIHSVVTSIDHTPVTSPSGFTITPQVLLSDISSADIICLPALWRNPRPALHRYADYIPWLKHCVNNGATVIAVGTGVCFLASAGLLDEQPATTHWHYFDQFQKDYPQVALKRQHFITRAGNLYCAASVNAMAELMVHLVERTYGRFVASTVERNFFHEIRGSFEPASFFSENVEYHPDEQVVQAQIWLEDNFHRQIKITNIAEQFEFNTRTFNRRFKQAVGKTPLQYLQQIRLKNATELLKNSNLSIAEVASHTGYQSNSSFCKVFQQHFKVPPIKYRETVRGKLFSTR